MIGLIPALVASLLFSSCGGGERSPAGSASPPPGDYLPLSFEVLMAFPVPEPGEPAPPSLVPPEILDLNGRPAAIQGYMIPVDMEAEGTNRFVLLYCALACCYGKMPKVNEWIDVTMRDGKRVRYYPEQPVWVTGRFEVQEDLEGGSLVGLYWMQADAVIGP